ncbi:hypothetical protein H6G76_35090 [Nostoc sp. FACHB-152]|uniref:allene oxide cyclase barrel-like domain-containing protein n=1 Tax=Nostoc sp. FACHB-152 TaxID=2692837 RepID=UPI0016895E8A|nr:hypothetical protein [Nostoc sp. FACHB-152]MBD2452237.1 hypothetical protein [Nostoc sp. FACHB-152]
MSKRIVAFVTAVLLSVLTIIIYNSVGAFAIELRPNLELTDKGTYLAVAFEVPPAQQLIPAPPQPASSNVGATTLMNSDLFNKSGTKVGSRHGFCIIINPSSSLNGETTGELMKCEQVLLLPQGSINISGVFNRTAFDQELRPSVSAIVGGTGKFSKARGEVHIFGSGPNVAIHTYKIYLS